MIPADYTPSVDIDHTIAETQRVVRHIEDLMAMELFELDMRGEWGGEAFPGQTPQ